MADPSINDLRALACRQRHGAHFMDSRDSRSAGYVCKHCRNPNTSNEHFIRGVSVWNYQLVSMSIRAYKDGERVFDCEEGTTKEVQHALQLVGYRADGSNGAE